MKKLLKASVPLYAALFVVVTACTAYAGVTAPAQTTTIEAQNPNVFEGWIVKIDYTKNMFRLLDPRGFEKKIKTKPGIIGDYRMGDRIRVEVDPTIKTAYTIEKIV